MQSYLDKTASLAPLAKKIIADKATEYPHSGEYNLLGSKGSYLCRRCGLALFRTANQFHSGCGWPSFDEEIVQAVKQIPDSDGYRTEIVCARCEAHLGHIFTGEGFTAANIRHCVNSVSLDFVADTQVMDTEEAIVAGGCFWGIDHFLKLTPGVLKTVAGYTGGHSIEPNYEQVCSGNTGHYEAVRILYDITKTNYSHIIKRFFEIHDPTDREGQGPDRGHQYLSAIFCYNETQTQEAWTLIKILQSRGYQVTTRLLPVQIFWPAEIYHQDYYSKHHKTPYCHALVKRFGET